MQSAVGQVRPCQTARLALETMVKIIYRLKDWRTKERPTILELTTDDRFRAFVDSPEMMKRIHYIRKIGEAQEASKKTRFLD